MVDNNTIICEKCGKEVDASSIICMYCGHGIKKIEMDYNVASMTQNSKKASVGIARVIAFIALFMNLVTIILSVGDFALRYVCLFTALICGVISLAVVIMSFSISSKNSEEEINEKVGTITKVVTGVLIFSGVDFFVAINSALFGF